MVGVGRPLGLERREGEGRFGVEESFHRIGLDWIGLDSCSQMNQTGNSTLFLFIT